MSIGVQKTVASDSPRRRTPRGGAAYRQRRTAVAVMAALVLSLAAWTSPAAAGDGLTVEVFDDAAITSPYALTAGPDGNIWFTNRSDDTIGRLTPAGVGTTFGDPTIAEPWGITVGPDDALWFNNFGREIPEGSEGDSLGRITLGGEVSAPVEMPNNEDIARGPDGNLWVAAFESIYRVTPGGTRTSFGGFGYVSAVAAGPDGNVWATDTSNALIRITPTGDVTTFVDPALDRPIALSAGPDGNIWFAQRNGVGRTTPDGAITVFPAPGAGHELSISAGPDGNVWFTAGDTINRITPDGDITAFSDPAFVAPRAITEGPAGNDLWVIQSNTTITKVTVPMAGGIAGVVTDGGGQPLANVTVTAVVSGDPDTLTTTTTGVDGAYLLEELPEGDYVVHFHRSDLQPLCFASTPTCAPGEVTQVSVGVSGITGDIDVTMAAAVGGSISGTVTDGIGGGLEGVQVWVFGSGFSSAAMTLTGADGTYTVPSLPDGVYFLWFNAPGVGSQCYANPGCTWGGATPAVVDDGDHLVGYDATFGVGSL
ncbi:MAG: carboxypeptidase regulatory-like domain-containing protein [Acidimicrobiia bacterium]|nr:carboxypeptidase regulatory-like domain-containing protein [Acidimicrobiia bacterium]